MINLATETDIERVRQVAILLERENTKLHKRLAELTEKLAHAEGKDATTLQLEIAFLKESLDRHQIAARRLTANAGGSLDAAQGPSESAKRENLLSFFFAQDVAHRTQRL